MGLTLPGARARRRGRAAASSGSTSPPARSRRSTPSPRAARCGPPTTSCSTPTAASGSPTTASGSSARSDRTGPPLREGRRVLVRRRSCSRSTRPNGIGLSPDGATPLRRRDPHRAGVLVARVRSRARSSADHARRPRRPPPRRPPRHAAARQPRRRRRGLGLRRHARQRRHHGDLARRRRRSSTSRCRTRSSPTSASAGPTCARPTPRCRAPGSWWRSTGPARACACPALTRRRRLEPLEGPQVALAVHAGPPHVLRRDPRLPEEPGRLRQAGGHAPGRRHGARSTTPRTPTSSS